MKRRDVIAGFIIALGIFALSPPSGAKETSKVARIGYLGTNIGPASLPPIDAFREGLRQLGYIEGQNIIVEFRWARGQADEASVAQAAELVRLDLDLIVAANSTYVPALRQASSTIPIVFCVSTDAVAEGIVASLARPGGNSTGLSVAGTDFVAKSFELLTEAVPGARRIAVLWDQTLPQHKLAMPVGEGAARNLAVELRPVSASTADEFEAAFEAIRNAGAQAMLVLGSSVSYSNRARLATLALKHRLPSMMGNTGSTEAGFLLSYGPNLAAQFRRCAVYVDKILKGAKPAELPVEQPTKFDLTINLKTAKALGITIPPSLLARADEVIE
jgi:putative ABC transport system substrate-binding protein